MAKKKKSRINQMRYGEMNFLGSAYGKSTFDPSRVDIISVLQGSNTDYYTANVIAGKRRWNAIVLRSTRQTYATVSSEFQRTYTVFERGNEDGEFVHFTYKIYIAELDGFKKIPEKFSSNSEDVGLVNLCRDALSPLGQSYGRIDYGTPVEVVFADQEKLRHPIIVDVHWNRRISLQSGKEPLWTTSGPRMTVQGGGSATAADDGRCAKMLANQWSGVKTFTRPSRSGTQSAYDKWRPLVNIAAEKYGLPRGGSGLAKLIDHESHWDPLAYSSATALGLAQFIPLSGLGHPTKENKDNRLMWFSGETIPAASPGAGQTYRDFYLAEMERIRKAQDRKAAWAWLIKQPPETWIDRRAGGSTGPVGGVKGDGRPTDGTAQLVFDGAASHLLKDFKRFKGMNKVESDEDAWVFAVAAYNGGFPRVKAVINGDKKSLRPETCWYVQDIGPYFGSRNPFILIAEGQYGNV